MVREFILGLVKPGDLDEESFSILDEFWVNDTCLVRDRLVSSIVRSHLRYLKWYCQKYRIRLGISIRRLAPYRLPVTG